MYKSDLLESNHAGWWKKYSTWYREQRNWTCEVCQFSLKDDRYYLHTHHIWGTRHNDPKDLMALCIGCHSDAYHKWQRQRYKDGLPYANYNAMSAHLTDLKRTTHPHWNALPSQAIQEELKRIHLAYDRFFKKLGGRPHIKARHKFKSITYPGPAGWSLKNNRITLTFRKWNPKTRKWQFDKVPAGGLSQSTERESRVSGFYGEIRGAVAVPPV